MPNRPKSRLVTSTDTRNAAPVIAAQNSPKNPARSPASGNRSVAAVAHGRYSEKNRTENSTAASVIHTSSLERRTYPNATVEVSPRRRVPAPGPADPGLRERPGRGQHDPAQDERDRERGRPDQEEVLRPDHAHERLREQAAGHRPEDLAGREQREQPLGAAACR